MQTTNFDFENDKMLAKHAYAMAEKFIRSCESANTNNSNNKLNSINGDSSLYDEYNADFDYFIVGKVCSLSANRQASFTQFVETDSTDKADRNERAYKWLMFNAVYELYTNYLMDAFYYTYVDANEDADVWKGYGFWCNSIRSEVNGKRVFNVFKQTQELQIA